MAKNNFKIATLNSHPIQYFGPLFRHISSNDHIDLTVFYYSDIGIKSYFDKGFKKEIQWDRDLIDGYKYKVLPNVRKKNELKGFLNLINLGLYKELKQGQFDAAVIHGTNYFTDVFAILCCKILGIKVLMRRSIHLQLGRSRSALKEKVVSLLTRMCDGCLAISDRNREYFLSMDVENHKIFDIPHVVDNQHFIQTSALSDSEKKEIKIKYELPLDKKVILFASKIFKRKRPKDLLIAFSELKRDDTILLFVGDGEQLPELISIVEDGNINNVYFTGFINQKELPKIYSASDIFVLPSEKEPWGLVINEAMCAGLPIITTREIGAVPEIVKHGETAFTYETGDVNQLTNYLEQLVADDEMRREMGRNALAFISGYNYDLFSQQLLNIMEEVTEKR